uniref:Uncharacterized protein n=1 Tax=Amphimedon queenslandica TaxID=400682 RepID=A0A1X7VS51_AMPQE
RGGRRPSQRPPTPPTPQPRLIDQNESDREVADGGARGRGRAQLAEDKELGEKEQEVVVEVMDLQFLEDMRAEVGEERESGAGQDIELELPEKGGSLLSLRDPTLSIMTEEEEWEGEEEVGEEQEREEWEEEEWKGGKDSLHNKIDS